MPAQQALHWDMPQTEWEGQAEALPARDDGPMNVGLIASKYFTKSTNKKLWDGSFGQKEATKEICCSMMQNLKLIEMI